MLLLVSSQCSFILVPQKVCQHREPFFIEVPCTFLSFLGKNPHPWEIIARSHNELISSIENLDFLAGTRFSGFVSAGRKRCKTSVSKRIFRGFQKGQCPRRIIPRRCALRPQVLYITILQCFDTAGTSQSCPHCARPTRAD